MTPPASHTGTLASPLPAEIKVSAFARAADNRPIAWAGTWEAWTAELLQHGHTIGQVDGEEAKATFPMFSPATFVGTRHETNVTGLYLAVFDYDHTSNEAVAQAVLAAQAQGWAVFAYSSWKHAPWNASMRLVLPLSRPAAREEWPALWARVRALLGGGSDAKVKDASRGYFLPSTHASRAPYRTMAQWPGLAIDTDRVLALPMPAEILVAAQGPGTQRVSVADLKGLHARLRRTNPAMALALAHVLNGEPFADQGFRDDTLFRLCGELAKAFPEADPEALSSHFTASMAQWTDLTPKDAADKIARRQREHATVRVLAESAQLEAARSRILEATAGARTAPYTQAEVDAEAKDQAPLGNRWIIQKAKSFWFYVLGKGYHGPFTAEESTRAAHTYLAPCTGVGVRLTELTDLGRQRHRTIQELVQDYGQVAVNVAYDLSAQRTEWIPGEANLTLAPCPKRTIQPKYHAKIDLWLRTLGGETYPYLEEWLAYIVHTGRPLVALYLEGPAHAGKSLLADGLSRIWTQYGPSRMHELVGAFNASAARCPLVFADEIMPRELRGRTAELRELIQARSRPYSQKFMASASLLGCFRIMMGANNRSLLEGEETLTGADVEAIAGRILHVVIPHETAWWKEFFDRTGTEGWVSGDKIAEHCLYLSAQHPLRADMPRFLINPPTAELSRTIATSTVAGSAVAHWLVAFLLNPSKLHLGKALTDSGHLVRVQEGTLYASSRTLAEYWDTYQTNVAREKATLRTIVKGLGALSSRQTRIHVHKALRPRLFAIRKEDLISWAESTGMADREQIEAALARDTAEPGAGVRVN